jgi:hypothetical protein
MLLVLAVQLSPEADLSNRLWAMFLTVTFAREMRHRNFSSAERDI